MDVTKIKASHIRLALMEAAARGLTSVDREEFVATFIRGLIDTNVNKEESVAAEVVAELRNARINFGAMRGPHEALGVIYEEFDEFKDEVWAFNLNKNRDTRPAMRRELIQLAAMAMRAIVEVTDEGRA